MRSSLLVLVLLAAACGGQYPATSSTPLSDAELKYRLIDQFGAIIVCGPPVRKSAEAAKADAVAAFPDIQKDADTFNAIVRHTQLAGVTQFSDDQKLVVYNEFQRLKAMNLDASGHFALLFADSSDPKRTVFVEGAIDRYGAVRVTTRESRGPPNCPICLAAGTRIDTPAGPIAIEDLGVGTAVWTRDEAGQRIVVPVVRTSRTPVPAGHEVVRLRLDDGRELEVSPGHPDASGHAVGDLQVGDTLDGGRVVHAARITYARPFTFDILPSGGTGLYWANGVLLRSTLADLR